jgi:hypothetical protein
MPSKHPLMKLRREEESFLHRWIFDEAHYLEGQGPAKRLQLQHRAIPADLAILIAASMPDPADQEAAALGPPPPGPLAWPWSEETYRARLAEAHAVLATRTSPQISGAVTVPGPRSQADRTGEAGAASLSPEAGKRAHGLQ